METRQSKDLYEIIAITSSFVYNMSVLQLCQCARKSDNRQSFKLLDDEMIDSNQMMINKSIAEYYFNLNLNKAIDYFEKSKYLSEKLNDKAELASNYYNLGSCYLSKGKFDLSLENYLKAVRLYEELKYKRRLIKAYIDIAYLFTEYSHYAKAQEYFEKPNC